MLVDGHRLKDYIIRMVKISAAARRLRRCQRDPGAKSPGSELRFG